MSISSEHLPRHLWWVLIGITLVWGFNWTAMKVAISEVAPFTFRTFCLAAGSGVLFAVLKASGQHAQPLRIEAAHEYLDMVVSLSHGDGR